MTEVVDGLLFLAPFLNDKFVELCISKNLRITVEFSTSTCSDSRSSKLFPFSMLMLLIIEFNSSICVVFSSGIVLSILI